MFSEPIKQRLDSPRNRDSYLFCENSKRTLEPCFEGLPLVLGDRHQALERGQHRNDNVAEPLAARTEELVGHHLPDGRSEIRSSSMSFFFIKTKQYRIATSKFS